MTVITTEKLGGPVGARVVGVDRERLLSDESLPAWVMEALEEHGALVFPELFIDDDTQIAFSRRLGDLVLTSNPDRPEIYIVALDPSKNAMAEYLRGAFEWHIDGSMDDVPTKASLLSVRALAAKGGETEFASTYAAYEALSEEEQERFGELQVIHSFEASQRRVNPDPTAEQVEAWKLRGWKEHPLVWRHASGRCSLLIGGTASHVVGMDLDEGRALLADLEARATAPARVYRHHWSLGDMVIWDNCGVMHRVCPYDPSSSREMHRTTLVGVEPIQ